MTAFVSSTLSPTNTSLPLRDLIIVDCHKTFRSQLKSHFEDLGSQPVCADNLESAAEIIDSRFFDIILICLPFAQEKLQQFFSQLQMTKPGSDVIILGSQKALASLAPMNYHVIAGLLSKDALSLVALDNQIRITLNKRKYINKLRQQSKQLAWELEEQNHKKATLEEDNLRKEQFIKQLSSNLLVPLNQLAQFADMGLERIRRKETSLAGDYLAESKLITQELSIYIKDLIEITKLSSGESEFDIEEVDIKEFFKKVKAQFQPIAENSSIRLSTKTTMENHYVYADYNKLYKVLVILLRNAFRYVPEKGKISIEATEDGQTCYIKVQDNGPGIPIEKRKKLFNMYDQNLMQNKLGIMGFALSICKALMVGQKGDIWLSDEAKKGCLFYLSLPVADFLFD